MVVQLSDLRGLIKELRSEIQYFSSDEAVQHRLQSIVDLCTYTSVLAAETVVSATQLHTALHFLTLSWSFTFTNTIYIYIQIQLTVNTG